MPDTELDDELEAALRHEAGVTPAQVPGPPRVAESADPDAPHGRADDGTPNAPYGLKSDGKPRLKPAGPGRGHKSAGDKPREIDKPPEAKTPAAAGDYTDQLTTLATAVWIGGSAFQGGTLPLLKVRTPDLRAYAMLWHQQMPAHIAAWNAACQQSPAVRGWVGKFGGEGGMSWVIGVGVVSANFLAAATELAKKENAELRAQFADANGRALAEFLAAQVPGAAQAAA